MLVAPDLAEQGFAMTPHLHAALARDQYLKLWEPAKSCFYLPDGAAKPADAGAKPRKRGAQVLSTAFSADADSDGSSRV